MQQAFLESTSALYCTLTRQLHTPHATT